MAFHPQYAALNRKNPRARIAPQRRGRLALKRPFAVHTPQLLNHRFPFRVHYWHFSDAHFSNPSTDGAAHRGSDKNNLNFGRY
jgi:hypothetical protein